MQLRKWLSLASQAHLVLCRPKHQTVLGETSASRSYFYIGGQYADDGNGGTIYKDQMYVERLAPTHGRDEHLHPIVLIHGQAQTGTNWLNKPDGGVGWASRFLEEGRTVYIVDQTFRGRSPWAPGMGAAEPSTYSVETIERRFTATQDYNLWPQASLHTQWPGNGSIGDEVFDNFYAANVQFILNATYQESTVQAAGALLLDRIGEPVLLLGHSQGGLMPTLIADARPELTAGMILLEPSGPPFQDAVFSYNSTRPWGLTDIPLTYSPPVTDPSVDLVQQFFPAPVGENDNSTVPCILQAESPAPRILPNLAPKPILVVTSESSYHAPYDYCTVEYLKQAGCGQTRHVELAAEGVRGNGHMMFMEKNSDEIWQLLDDWIVETVGTS